MSEHPAWLLVIIGAVLLVFGLLWLLAPSIPWLGRLPGDIHIQRDHFHFYFPLATSLLLSVVLTLIMWVISYFSR